ncbi:MAG TPA: porin, partial [Hyphomicrobiaceae bacterium]|nr:porin [Hyphomicrobiaceae bacterium]
FRGSAKIDSDLSAGYRIEIGIRTANSGAVSQFEEEPSVGNFEPGDDLGSGLDLRHAFWYIQSQRLGTLTVGQTDTPTSSTFTLTLANIPHIEADPSNMGAGMFVRRADGTLSDIPWADFMHPNQGSLSRRNEVMYTTPTWAGFQASAAWGEADFWSVSLAWAGEHHGFRAAAKVAYADISDAATFGYCEAEGGSDSEHTEVDCHHWVLGASIMHVSTGLFVSGGYVNFTDDNRKAALGAQVDDNDEAWYIHFGIEQKWHALGKTTIYGEYGEQENGAAVAEVINAGYGGETMSYWGLGVVQSIDAAAMDLYLFYRQLSVEVPTSVLGQGAEDLSMVGAGAIIRF